MKFTPTDVYTKLQKIDKEVKIKLFANGAVVPVLHKNGSIGVGRYKIIKTKAGFYNIIDKDQEVIIKQINLPQSAALLANKLALGKWIDTTILNADRSYGHAAFEEELQTALANKKLKKKEGTAAEILYTKAKISKLKKDKFKKEILFDYEHMLIQRIR